jgi:hypothetical protein
MECPAPWYELLDQAGAESLFIAAAGVLAVAFVFRVIVRFLRNS